MGVRERSARRQGFVKRTSDGGIGFRTVIIVPRGTMVYGEGVVLGLIVPLVGVQGLEMYMRIVM